MFLDFNDFILALSCTLDLNLIGNKINCNHSKRICYISIKLSQLMNFTNKETYDMALLLLLYNTQNNLREFIQDLYHRVKKPTVPVFSDEKYDLIEDMLKLSSFIDMNFNLQRGDRVLGNSMVRFIKEYYGSEFNPLLIHVFSQFAEDDNFWLDLKDSSINPKLKCLLNIYSDCSHFIHINDIAQVLCSIIGSNPKTGMHSASLAEKVEFMADYLSIKGKEKHMTVLAAELHDLGKVAISSTILDKPFNLTNEEFQIIKTHPYYTRYILSQIKGFEAVTEWASNHHEKLNGKGYPFGFTQRNLDFNSKLIACLDIYQALTEQRPYRKELTHKSALRIMERMYTGGEIDGEILRSIRLAFA